MQLQLMGIRSGVVAHKAEATALVVLVHVELPELVLGGVSLSLQAMSHPVGQRQPKSLGKRPHEPPPVLRLLALQLALHSVSPTKLAGKDHVWKRMPRHTILKASVAASYPMNMRTDSLSRSR